MDRRALLIVLALAAAVAVPSLGLPWMMDDWFHQGALRTLSGESVGRSPEIFEGWVHPGGLPALFSFFRDPALTSAAIADGSLPWWTDPSLQIRFLRPLSSLSHLADHVLFPGSAAAAHLHSLAWYLILCAVVLRVYRPLGAGLGARLRGPALALLPAAMFALDEGHWHSVAWVAGRNALISATFGLLGLLAHRRWQEAAWRPGLPLSVLGLGLGLAGGEGGLGLLGLVACYQLLAAPGERRQRLRGLVPVLLVFATWTLVYKAGGYGARHSGVYIDPGAEPLFFLSRALVRGPVLLGGLVLGQPVDLFFFSAATKGALIFGGLASCALLPLGLHLSKPHLSEAARHELRWLVPGGLLALLPVLATFPLGRLLLVPGIGLFPALAAMLLVARSQGRRVFAGVIVLVHLALPPLGWWGLDGLSYGIAEQFDTMLDEAPLADPRPALVMPVADPSLAVYMPVEAGVTGLAFPHPWQLTTVSGGRHMLTRLDASSLRLEAPEAPMGQAIFEQLFRDFDASPLDAGFTVDGPLARVTVEQSEEGRPTVLRLDLSRPVEELRLLQWTGQRFEELAPPELHHSIWLEHHPGPMGL